MKKTILATIVASALIAPMAVNAASGHIGNQSGKDNELSIDVGDIDYVMGNICNQSGNNNSCDVEIDDVKGDVIISDGASVTIVQEGSDGKDGKDGINGTNGTDGKDGADGTDGKDGTNGIDGTNGTDGKDGVDGVDGKDGADGINGKDGKDGVDGINGTNGTDGKDGVDGVDGKDGVDGTNGKDGVDGVDGTNGKDGVDGINGKDGEGATVTDNGDGTVTVTGSNGSVEIVQGSEYDDTELRNDVTNVASQLDDSIDVLVDGEGNGYGAVITDENGNSIEVLDRAATDQIIVDNINQADAINANREQITAESETRKAEDEAIRTDFAEDQARQDAELKAVDQASKDRDAELATAIDAGDKVTLEAAKVDATEKAKAAETNANKFTSEVVAEEAKIRQLEDAKLSGRITQNEYDIYSNTQVNRRQDATLANHEKRLGALESDVSGLKQDITRLDGMIAANAATAAMEMPVNWNGEWAMQVGAGYYNSQSALALGIVGGNEAYTVKATAAGTSADDWNELVYGASVTISTAIFD